MSLAACLSQWCQRPCRRHTAAWHSVGADCPGYATWRTPPEDMPRLSWLNKALNNDLIKWFVVSYCLDLLLYCLILHVLLCVTVCYLHNCCCHVVACYGLSFMFCFVICSVDVLRFPKRRDQNTTGASESAREPFRFQFAPPPFGLGGNDMQRPSCPGGCSKKRLTFSFNVKQNSVFNGKRSKPSKLWNFIMFFKLEQHEQLKNVKLSPKPSDKTKMKWPVVVFSHCHAAGSSLDLLFGHKGIVPQFLIEFKRQFEGNSFETPGVRCANSFRLIPKQTSKRSKIDNYHRNEKT